MRARSVLVVVGWVAVAAVACSLAIGVVTLLDDGLGTQAPPPKSEKEVERDLAGVPDVQPQDAKPDGGGATSPDQGASPDPQTSGDDNDSPGGATPTEPPDPSKEFPKESVRNDASGVVGARCAVGKPTISYAQPAQGYQYEGVDDDDDGDGRVSVKFSSENRDATFVVTCPGATAKIAVQASTDDDDDDDDRGES